MAAEEYGSRKGDNKLTEGGRKMSAAKTAGEEKNLRQGRPRVAVDVKQILNLYLEKKMSVRQVAREVGVSHVTVARRITEETGHLRSWRMPGEI